MFPVLACINNALTRGCNGNTIIVHLGEQNLQLGILPCIMHIVYFAGLRYYFRIYKYEYLGELMTSELHIAFNY